MPSSKRQVEKNRLENAELSAAYEERTAARLTAKAQAEAALVAAGAPTCQSNGCIRPARKGGLCLAHTVI